MYDLIKQYKDKIYLFLFGLFTFPVFYGRVLNGLDGSWNFLLNFLPIRKDLKFGRDVFFTYGPIGFLNSPLYIHKNYLLGICVFSLVWLCALLLFSRMLRNCHIYDPIIILALVIMYIASPVDTVDLFFQFVALLALAVLWRNSGDLLAYVILNAIIVIVFFYKASITLAIVVALFFYVIGKVFLKDYRFLYIPFISFLLIPIIYLVYNHSISDFVEYIRTNLEMSFGFNTAMATFGNGQDSITMFLLMGLYAALMVFQLLYGKTKNFWGMLWVAPCLFMSYKHGFVRADGHIVLGYIEIMATFSVVLLIFEFDGLKEGLQDGQKKSIAQMILITAMITSSFLAYNESIHPWINMTTRFQRISAELYELSPKHCHDYENSVINIPESISKVIGADSYTSYPWEITFIKNTEQTNGFMPLPVFQIYAAYTPYLDEKCAYFFSDGNGPQYIIFSFETIDDRIPLLEAPLTWKAICQNYSMCMIDEDTDYCILKRMDEHSRVVERSESEQMSIYSTVEFLDSDDVAITANLSLKGRIVNLLWKIPEVTATITYDDGTVIEGRVVVDNLRSGCPSVLPYDENTLAGALAGNEDSCQVESIKLAGNGLGYYKDQITVTRFDCHVANF